MSSGIGGFPSTTTKKCDDAGGKRFVNITPTGCDNNSLNVVPRGFYYLHDQTAPLTLTDGGSDFVEVTNLNTFLTSDAQVGDIVQFLSSGNCIFEASVESIVGDRLTLNKEFDPILAAGDTIYIRRAVLPALDQWGNESLSSIKFIYDGAPTDVLEDTVTPANNRPLPVKLTGITGDINITANDLNVQLSHNSAVPDSTQIGDGNEIWAINPSNEGLVHDTDALAQLVLLLAELEQKTEPTDIQLVDVTTSVLPTGAATSALQGTQITNQGTIITSLGTLATEATLALINGKMNSLGQKASASSMPVVMSTAQEAIFSGMLASLQLLDDAVNGTTFNVTLSDLGGAATEAKQDTIITNLGTINTNVLAGNALLTSLDGKDFATQTTLAAQAANIALLQTRIGGDMNPKVDFDYRDFTYVLVGNGLGEIETIVYRTGGAAGAIVGTRTFGYDASSNIISDERS